ncbi:MAG: hypothetical protein KDB80_07230, partial [Planctomycetes bacterium]|nr:hypothetical protein [Planctomycetota bacterium]
MTLSPNLMAAVARGLQRNRPIVEGQVRSLRGIAIEVAGIRAAVGELCTIRTAQGDVDAEVVGFRDRLAVIMPLGEPIGIAPGDPVVSHARPLCVTTGDGLRGRVL